ncbi:hypothetical protein [Streptomyces sp. NPDC020983]|uniref:hypothetical protein n=1 Tax=Streptomyces sp. NPDC020983 TaxID=3365106 RepID=UPI0037BD3244
MAAGGALGLALLAAPQAVATGGTPTTPTELFNGYRACSTDPAAPAYLSGNGGVELEGIPALIGDEGMPTVTATEEFQVHPVADPARVTSLILGTAVLGNEGWVTVPVSALTDGQAYAWQARTVAGTAASDWSAPCYFVADNTRPSTPPAVTSDNYPQDQISDGGDPVRFTFDANGVDDVEGYEFAWQDPLPVHVVGFGEHAVPQPSDPYADSRYYVRADHLGGSATVSLIPPAGFGPVTLHVVSLDRAGTRSFDEATYGFRLTSQVPTVTPPANPAFDEPATFRFTPNAQLQAKSPTVSYTVRTLGGQHDQTVEVPADEDGSARITLKLDGIYGEEDVLVSSTSANGWVSDEGGWSGSFDTETTVTSDVYPEDASGGGVGVPGAFTFTPKVPHVVSYTYSFNYGEPVTVKAGLGHAARVTWTPEESGFTSLTVDATLADGTQLATRYYYFTVN